MYKNCNKKVKEKGQVLLFVVVAATVALALSVGVSLQTISTITNVSDSDTSQRSYAAAEGAAERTLTLDVGQLSQLSAGGSAGFGPCSSSLGGTWDSSTKTCTIAYTSTGDDVRTQSQVVVTEFRYTDPADSTYAFTVEMNNLKEVELEGYGPDSVRVCWSGEDVDMLYSIYDSAGAVKKELVACGSSPCANMTSSRPAIGTYVSAFSPGSGNPFDYCYDVSWPSTFNPIGLRIRPVGNSAHFGVSPATGEDLPYQGYKISVTGRLQSTDEIIRRIHLYRSYAYLPGIMDFAIYAGGTATSL